MDRKAKALLKEAACVAKENLKEWLDSLPEEERLLLVKELLLSKASHKQQSKGYHHQLNRKHGVSSKKPSLDFYDRMDYDRFLK